ncbi:VOC family protein [Stenotrophomonas sp. YIM B06876]|uniref:VOC family protein n=1 Tax=Stenotrophomonas sp. YIM B06876 TaxID=3060211 RepID=UPI002738786A|nr:VOC family protein [Stenotrophomonas sp. YIM B06876]
MPKITPCLWFDTQAQEAVAFYSGIFASARTLRTTHYGEGAPRPADMVLTIEFELEGQRFIALNGGPEFPFTPAVSLSVECQTQDEVDRLWQQLGAGGRPGQCGWLQDKYGLSWQIVPHLLPELLSDPDPRKAQAVMQALMGMHKLDIAALQNAHARA